jgi:predicted phage tail protein
MEKEIRVYGPLAKFVGFRRIMAEVSNAAEAVRMLIANFPGLEQHMIEHDYKVVVDRYEADVEEIAYPASQTIQIIPVIGGAGGGVGKVIAGIALVAGAIILGPAVGGFFGLGAGLAGTGGVAGATAAGIIGGVAATITGTIGLGLIAMGVSQMLTPTPKISGVGGGGYARQGATSSEGTAQDPQDSYSFSGIQNTSKQGVPVPLIYGETVVGSIVISAGIDIDS